MAGLQKILLGLEAVILGDHNVLVHPEAPWHPNLLPKVPQNDHGPHHLGELLGGVPIVTEDPVILEVDEHVVSTIFSLE